MSACSICLRKKVELQFDTKHVSICAECVTAINAAKQPAQGGFDYIGGLLRKGMGRKRDGFVSQDEFERALSRWTNKLLRQKTAAQP